MSNIEDRLHDLALEAGIELIETRELDARFNAVFHSPSRRVFVRSGLDPATRVCAIAHELGHAANNDTCSSSRAERLADEWAAMKLIDGDTVADLAHVFHGASTAIAAELGITPHLLGIWHQLVETGRIKPLPGATKIQICPA